MRPGRGGEGRGGGRGGGRPVFLELRVAVNAYHNRLSAPGSEVTPPITIKHVTGGGDGRTGREAQGKSVINYFWHVEILILEHSVTPEITGQTRHVLNITNISLLRQPASWLLTIHFCPRYCNRFIKTISKRWKPLALIMVIFCLLLWYIFPRTFLNHLNQYMTLWLSQWST